MEPLAGLLKMELPPVAVVPWAKIEPPAVPIEPCVKIEPLGGDVDGKAKGDVVAAGAAKTDAPGCG